MYSKRIIVLVTFFGLHLSIYAKNVLQIVTEGVKSVSYENNRQDETEW